MVFSNVSTRTVRLKGLKKFLLFLLLAEGGCWLTANVSGYQSGAGQEHQTLIRRLILTDGSYELISQYQIREGRVRYLSSERHTWEEMPYSLVDWAATREYAAREAREASGRMVDARAEAAKDHQEEEARIPLVAPGMRLPSSGGIFLLDMYQNRPELNKLVQNGADLNKRTASNILRGVINPVAGSSQTVELPGLHASIQSHTPLPSIYLAIDPGDPLMTYTSETAKDHLRIVRCEQNKGNRIVVEINVAISGKVRQQAQYVEAKVEPLSDYWVKVTPAAPMPADEYALVELDEKGAVNLFVWDFGVNPLAAANPAPEQSAPERGAPVLKEKPQKK
jgi:hypothetical protein